MKFYCNANKEIFYYFLQRIIPLYLHKHSFFIYFSFYYPDNRNKKKEKVKKKK